MKNLSQKLNETFNTLIPIGCLFAYLLILSGCKTEEKHVHPTKTIVQTQGESAQDDSLTQREGTSSGGGTFMHDEAEMLIEDSKNIAIELLLNAHPGIFAKMKEGWSKEVLIDIFRNLSLEPETAAFRHNGMSSKELVFDYFRNEEGKPRVRVLKAFFDKYGAEPYFSPQFGDTRFVDIRTQTILRIFKEIAHMILGHPKTPDQSKEKIEEYEDESTRLSNLIYASLFQDILICEAFPPINPSDIKLSDDNSLYVDIEDNLDEYISSDILITNIPSNHKSTITGIYPDKKSGVQVFLEELSSNFSETSSQVLSSSISSSLVRDKHHGEAVDIYSVSQFKADHEFARRANWRAPVPEAYREVVSIQIGDKNLTSYNPSVTSRYSYRPSELMLDFLYQYLVPGPDGYSEPNNRVDNPFKVGIFNFNADHEEIDISSLIHQPNGSTSFTYLQSNNEISAIFDGASVENISVTCHSNGIEAPYEAHFIRSNTSNRFLPESVFIQDIGSNFYEAKTVSEFDLSISNLNRPDSTQDSTISASVTRSHRRFDSDDVSIQLAISPANGCKRENAQKDVVREVSRFLRNYSDTISSKQPFVGNISPSFRVNVNEKRETIDFSKSFPCERRFRPIVLDAFKKN